MSKELRYGFTTGSCAAAASKAAAYMLLSGKEKNTVTIDTPKGIPYTCEILDIKRSENTVSCAVKKDGGDDPDVTSGALIYSAVSFDSFSFADEEKTTSQISFSQEENEKTKSDSSEIYYCREKIIILGGEGVGKVTKPGLDRPVGDAAINTVPREMIKKEVSEVCDLFDFTDTLKVVISVPGGEEIAKKTFNPRLGIEGGISIIGTSGIVEPMSTQAILDTIKVEMNQRRALGFDYAVISPGNYGLDFMKNNYGYDLDKSIKCGNYIGRAVDMAADVGFKRILFTGHVGKLIKVAGGIMNTHSKEADCRMEIISALAIKHYTEPETVREILECNTTEEAAKLLKTCGKCDEVMSGAVEKICDNLVRRSQWKIEVECIMFSKEVGELAKSKGADDFIKMLVNE
ncbi:MAG: cobalt-precorrin-5B (C(1))-methyltransferase CbiD [Lachnospiraceae bacterium]|nr:cobalt-precorrin-5B (C(1))-methyltransferase CbiD [Lachnospiraceae bacterium]